MPRTCYAQAELSLFWFTQGHEPENSRIPKNGQTKATSRLSVSQAASLSPQACSSLGKSTALKHKSLRVPGDNVQSVARSLHSEPQGPQSRICTPCLHPGSPQTHLLVSISF